MIGLELFYYFSVSSDETLYLKHESAFILFIFYPMLCEKMFTAEFRSILFNPQAL